jgi:hypothetical protein
MERSSDFDDLFVCTVAPSIAARLPSTLRLQLVPSDRIRVQLVLHYQPPPLLHPEVALIY